MNKNNTWRPTCFVVQTTDFSRPAKFLILLKSWGYDNFELNWFPGCQRVQRFPFPRWAPTQFVSIFRNALDLFTLSLPFARHFARRLIMQNFHETSTQRARYLYPDSKNNLRRITYGIGCVWEMPSLSPLSSLDKNHFAPARVSYRSEILAPVQQPGWLAPMKPRRHDILWWCPVKKYRAMRGKRSELAPVSCKHPLSLRWYFV